MVDGAFLECAVNRLKGHSLEFQKRKAKLAFIIDSLL